LGIAVAIGHTTVMPKDFFGCGIVASNQQLSIRVLVLFASLCVVALVTLRKTEVRMRVSVNLETDGFLGNLCPDVIRDIHPRIDVLRIHLGHTNLFELFHAVRHTDPEKSIVGFCHFKLFPKLRRPFIRIITPITFPLVMAPGLPYAILFTFRS
jgi:hypothetical protein